MDVAKSESEEVPSDLGADTAAAKVEAHADGVAATNSITYGQDADAIDAFLHSDDDQVDDYDYIPDPDFSASRVNTLVGALCHCAIAAKGYLMRVPKPHIPPNTRIAAITCLLQSPP